MTIPPFGEPLIRACSICDASVYCAGWYDLCPRCKGYICDQVIVGVLDRGIKVKVDGSGLSITIGDDDET